MKQKKSNTVSEQLRAAVESCPMTRYEISKQTGIDQGQLCRFVHGTSGLSFRSLDTLCELLGLELRPVKAKAKAKPKQRASKAAKKPTRKKGGK